MITTINLKNYALKTHVSPKEEKLTGSRKTVWIFSFSDQIATDFQSELYPYSIKCHDIICSKLFPTLTFEVLNCVINDVE